jgi:hypothetical protein
MYRKAVPSGQLATEKNEGGVSLIGRFMRHLSNGTYFATVGHEPLAHNE